METKIKWIFFIVWVQLLSIVMLAGFVRDISDTSYRQQQTIIELQQKLDLAENALWRDTCYTTDK